LTIDKTGPRDEPHGHHLDLVYETTHPAVEIRESALIDNIVDYLPFVMCLAGLS
jgi:hypothetical protein